MNYAQKLKQIAKASGLSQEDLADKLEVSFPTLNSWINAKSEPTRLNAKNKIDILFAEFLGADSVDKSELEKVKNNALKKKTSIKKIIDNHDLLDDLILNLTYHTNTIEGSTMTKNDVAEVIFDNKTLTNRTQIEQREAVNHRVALEFMLNELAKDSNLKWTSELILKTHLLLMNGILSNAGLWRNHSVRIMGSKVPLANFIKIPDLIKKLCNELNEETTDPIYILAKTHSLFEQIHPFSDGNGRTGRLIMFVKALQLGIVPPIVLKEKKNVYYKYLEISQVEEKFDLLEYFIALSILENSKIFKK
jgi:Fic family protein